MGWNWWTTSVRAVSPAQSPYPPNAATRTPIIKDWKMSWQCRKINEWNLTSFCCDNSTHFWIPFQTYLSSCSPLHHLYLERRIQQALEVIPPAHRLPPQDDEIFPTLEEGKTRLQRFALASQSFQKGKTVLVLDCTRHGIKTRNYRQLEDEERVRIGNKVLHDSCKYRLKLWKVRGRLIGQGWKEVRNSNEITVSFIICNNSSACFSWKDKIVRSRKKKFFWSRAVWVLTFSHLTASHLISSHLTPFYFILNLLLPHSLLSHFFPAHSYLSLISLLPTLLFFILYPPVLFLSTSFYLLLSCFLYSWNLLRVTCRSVYGNLFLSQLALITWSL